MRSPPFAAAVPLPVARSLQWRERWLWSPRIDLAIIGLPFAVALIAWVACCFTPDVSRVTALAVWTTQNVLCSATHVALTFLVLGSNPALRKADPLQSRRIAIGSIVFAILAVGAFRLFAVDTAAFQCLAAVVFNVFATHHLLSQSKGLWALRDVRSGAATPRFERNLRELFVPQALVLVLGRLFFVAEPISGQPFIDVGQGVLLPAVVRAAALSLWIVFSVAVLASASRADSPSGPKVAHLAATLAAVSLTLISPRWGAIVLPGIHGLEYLAISSRLVGAGRATRIVGRRWAMFAVMAPLFALGIGVGFLEKVARVSWAPTLANPLWRAAALAGLALTFTHYLADAMLFRFRIPEIRSVLLRQLD